MGELKNCPICNGEAEFERKGTTRYSTIVTCTDCGCTAEDGSTFNHEARWNTRPREEELEKENKKLNDQLTLNRNAYKEIEKGKVRLRNDFVAKEYKLKEKLYEFICYKCDTPLGNTPGIGPFCQNEKCDVLDGTRLWK